MYAILPFHCMEYIYRIEYEEPEQTSSGLFRDADDPG
jgi:hypothetical protein